MRSPHGTSRDAELRDCGVTAAALEEHAASEVAAGPHSRALFGAGPGGLGLPAVEKVRDIVSD